ncbi:type I 3-dehydroquinate dehydratase [Thermodesulfobacteriota bacterium]
MLCIPIIARDTEDAIRKISGAEKYADLCEIRLDLMDSFELGTILKSAEKPVIVTCRSEKEGGISKADPSDVSNILIAAAEEGAAYLDVELNMPDKWKQKIIQNRGKSRIIISSHIMGNTPSMNDLKAMLNDSIGTGVDIVKIVAMAIKWEDNLKLLELVKGARERDINIISFCMGHIGRMSRVCSLLMGGYLTFASLDSGQESAPGQMTIHEMKKALKIFSV